MADRTKKEKKEKKGKDKKGSKIAKGLVFGRSLEEVIELQNNGQFVPNIVRDTITWLEANGAFNEEGLFRVPGQMTIIENLKKEYDTRGTGTLDGITDVASVAGLLKLYLRELPEPLLVFRFYTTFVKIAKNPDAESRLRNLRILVNGLPEANKATVFYLLEFLSKVVANEKVNRMSAANLAMIFSPNLLRTEKEELSQIMMEAGYLTSIIKLMIEEIDFLTNKTDRPATLKRLSASGSMIIKPELVEEEETTNQSSSNDAATEVPLDEMKKRLSLAGSSGEIRAFLAAEHKKEDERKAKQQEDNNKKEAEEDEKNDLDQDKKPADAESSSSASEQKRKELEDIKQKVKEKEDLLRRLREQLDEADNNSSEAEPEDAGGEGSEDDAAEAKSGAATSATSATATNRVLGLQLDEFGGA